MFKTKFFATLLIVLAVLFVQVGGVLAAPAPQDTTITGTVTAITVDETDINGVVTVLVTVEDATGASETYRLSLEDATTLGLVTVDTTTNAVTVNEALIGQPLTFDPTLVVEDEEPFNPVAGMLSTFFGVSNSTINGYHDAGYGFGVIAQALWMAQGIDDPAITATDILLAKSSGDYSFVVLEDGSSPTNWGQFKKAFKEHKQNLGQIMSGHASNVDDATTTQSGNGNGNGRNNNNGNHGGGNNGNGKGNQP